MKFSALIAAGLAMAALMAVQCGGNRNTNGTTDSLADMDLPGEDMSLDFPADEFVYDVPEIGVDTDADGDTISDFHEGNGAIDTNGDGTPDTLDDDSDGDGYTDAEEAGDADISTKPVDSDGDLVPDFRDLDSDNDGLSDALERENGTNPRVADSDGDGVDDLVEVVAGTDPNDELSNPRLEGDFYFLVPYEEDPSPDRDTLVFQTNIRMADVYFTIDNSISMGPMIDNLRDSLRDTVIPGIIESIPDIQVGIGAFDICPSGNLGAASGTCYKIGNLQSTTTDVGAAEAALDALTANCRPVTEPYGQAMWLFATGDVSPWDGFIDPPECPAGSGVGYGCVREGAVPILVVMGDEPFSESYAHYYDTCSGGSCSSCIEFPTLDEIAAALTSISAKFIAVGPTASSEQYADIALATDSVDGDGNPLAFVTPGDGTGIGDQVVEAVQLLANQAPIDVTADGRDLDDDGVDATIFIRRIEANVVGGVADPRDPELVCASGLLASDMDDDGYPDTFPDLVPGTIVCFDIIPEMNTTVEPTGDPQIFKAAVDVIGDGVTVLDTREVFFLVPPVVDNPIY